MSNENNERDVVADFWRGVDQHDWELLASTISDDFVRIGMNDDEDDTSRGKERYMSFVEGVIGRMDHHDLKVTNIYYSPDRRFATAEAIETIEPPGEARRSMRFANVMELDEAGLISKLDIYWKTPKQMPPSWIAVTSVIGSE